MDTILLRGENDNNTYDRYNFMVNNYYVYNNIFIIHILCIYFWHKIRKF